MNEMAGMLPPKTPNKALDEYHARLERKERWHQKHGGAIVSGSVAVVLFISGIMWNVRRDDLTDLAAAKKLADKEQAELVESVRKVTSSVERLTEMAIENRTKNESQDKALDRGREDRVASEKSQDSRLSGIDTKLAVMATEQRATNDTLQRIIRKIEEARRTDGSPFDQRLTEGEARFPFILRVNGTVSRLIPRLTRVRAIVP